MNTEKQMPLLIEERRDKHLARHIIKQMRGGSGSLLICDWESKLWVVKFAQNVQHRHLVINEWLASYIAREIGLAVPASGVVQVSAELLKQYGEERQSPIVSELPYSPGLHYGSLFAGGLMPGRVLDVLPPDQWDRVVNLHEVIGALILDTWLNNTDVRQAVFARQGRSRSLKAIWIDHGNSFGQNWQVDRVPCCSLFRENPAYQSLVEWVDFEPWLSRIEAFPLSTVRQAFRDAPEAWRTGEEFAFELLLHQIAVRQRRIKTLLLDVIYQRRRYFPNWSATLRSHARKA